MTSYKKLRHIKIPVFVRKAYYAFLHKQKSLKTHLLSFIYRKIGRTLPDKCALKILFYLKTGKDLNIKNPTTYREKIQWLKLYDRNPDYTRLVDKILVKDHVRTLIGDEHVIPTLCIWETPGDIDFSALPNAFVIKCNHNSHIGLSIVKDKTKVDLESIRKDLWKGYNDNYFRRSREWAYKNVKRRILAEKYIESDATDGEEDVLTDYKYFCFNGEPKIMYVSKDIAKDPRTDFFDMQFNHLDIQMQDKNAETIPSKPKFFKEEIEAAKVLSRNIPFVRIDFYETKDNWLFGEMTFYPSSGMAAISSEQIDKDLGELITLPIQKAGI